MNFPSSISLTITNACNLRCQMCGQWSQEGYIRCAPERLKGEMTLADWQRVIDELAEHEIHSLLLRGGEPFVYPHIIPLMEYIHDKDMFISIDTNGTRIKDYAAEIARIGSSGSGVHLTISLDGPEAIHDQVRGVKGTYARVREGVAALKEAEQKTGKPISRSFNFTISGYNYQSLGALPEDIRRMGVPVVAVVPYYFFPEAVGKEYEQIMEKEFGCPAYSWIGFHHEESGVDFAEFQRQYRQYKADLGEIYDFPYMVFSEDQYRAWFADAITPVMPAHCTNVEKLIDIQPNGDANFCVDFVDYSFGNVREGSIEEIWNGERAERFRAYRREKPLPVCLRCGAKFMSEM
jgi:MoaA/NifB/PqqE/SkfB family radical SAM enzyme